MGNHRIRVVCSYEFEITIPNNLHDDDCPSMSDVIDEHLRGEIDKTAFRFVSAEELDPEI